MNVINLKHHVIDLNEMLNGTFEWEHNFLQDNYNFYKLQHVGNEEQIKELYTNIFEFTEKQFNFVYSDSWFNLSVKFLEPRLEKMLILINRHKLNDLVKGLKYLNSLALENATDTPIDEILSNVVTDDLDLKFWGNFLHLEKAEIMPYLSEEFSLSVYEVNSIFWSEGFQENNLQVMINNIEHLISTEIPKEF